MIWLWKKPLSILKYIRSFDIHPCKLVEEIIAYSCVSEPRGISPVYWQRDSFKVKYSDIKWTSLNNSIHWFLPKGKKIACRHILFKSRNYFRKYPKYSSGPDHAGTSGSYTSQYWGSCQLKTNQFRTDQGKETACRCLKSCKHFCICFDTSPPPRWGLKKWPRMPKFSI